MFVELLPLCRLNAFPCAHADRRLRWGCLEGARPASGSSAARPRFQDFADAPDIPLWRCADGCTALTHGCVCESMVNGVGHGEARRALRVQQSSIWRQQQRSSRCLYEVPLAACQRASKESRVFNAAACGHSVADAAGAVVRDLGVSRRVRPAPRFRFGNPAKVARFRANAQFGGCGSSSPMFWPTPGYIGPHVARAVGAN